MRRKLGSVLPIEIAILAVLARLRRREGPGTHGYEIAQRLREVSDSKRLTAYGTLYRALARLERMGLVASRWEDPSAAAKEARPARRFYTLTEAGAEARARSAAETRAAPRRREAARA